MSNTESFHSAPSRLSRTTSFHSATSSLSRSPSSVSASSYETAIDRAPRSISRAPSSVSRAPSSLSARSYETASSISRAPSSVSARSYETAIDRVPSSIASSVRSSRMGSIRSLLGKLQRSPHDSARSMDTTHQPKRRNSYETKSAFIDVPKSTLVSQAAHIRQVFEYALKITRIALQKAEHIIEYSKTKTVMSQNTIARVHRHAESIKHFLRDISRQESEWTRAMTSSKSMIKLPNWPLTPLSKHGALEGMHYKTAHEYAAPDVAAFMNEVGHLYQQSLDEAKRHKITHSTYGFDQARTKAELNLRLQTARRTMHPSLQPYLDTSYQKALKRQS